MTFDLATLESFSGHVQSLLGERSGDGWEEWADFARAAAEELSSFTDHPAFGAVVALKKATAAKDPRGSWEAARQLKDQLPSLLKAVYSHPEYSEEEGDPEDIEAGFEEARRQLERLEAFAAQAVMARRSAEPGGVGYFRRIGFDILDRWGDSPARPRVDVVNDWEHYYRRQDVQGALRWLEGEGYLKIGRDANGRLITYTLTPKAGRRRGRRVRESVELNEGIGDWLVWLVTDLVPTIPTRLFRAKSALFFGREFLAKLEKRAEEFLARAEHDKAFSRLPRDQKVAVQERAKEVAQQAFGRYLTRTGLASAAWTGMGFLAHSIPSLVDMLVSRGVGHVLIHSSGVFLPAAAGAALVGGYLLYLIVDWFREEPARVDKALGLVGTENPTIVTGKEAWQSPTAKGVLGHLWGESLLAAPTFRDLVAEQVVKVNGGLGNGRDTLPQIPGDKAKAYIAWLRDEGIKAQSAKRSAKQLKPSQGELDADKVAGMASDPDKLRDGDPIVTSKDGYVLDGHHRWAAWRKALPDEEMPILQVDLPIKDLIAKTREFPGAKVCDVEGNCKTVGEGLLAARSFAELLERDWIDYSRGERGGVLDAPVRRTSEAHQKIGFLLGELEKLSREGDEAWGDVEGPEALDVVRDALGQGNIEAAMKAAADEAENWGQWLDDFDQFKDRWSIAEQRAMLHHAQQRYDHWTAMAQALQRARSFKQQSNIPTPVPTPQQAVHELKAGAYVAAIRALEQDMADYDGPGSIIQIPQIPRIKYEVVRDEDTGVWVGAWVPVKLDAMRWDNEVWQDAKILAGWRYERGRAPDTERGLMFVPNDSAEQAYRPKQESRLAEACIDLPQIKAALREFFIQQLSRTDAVHQDDVHDALQIPPDIDDDESAVWYEARTQAEQALVREGLIRAHNDWWVRGRRFRQLTGGHSQ